MAQYIDKSALVAEIDNLKNIYKKCPTRNLYEEGLKNGRLIGYKDVLYKTNTIEVKEVDLEKEIKDYLDKEEFWNAEDNGKATECFARHFFELGLNLQRTISIDATNIDKVIEENGVDPNSKEAKMFRESYYMALEKLKARKGE